MRMTSKRFCSKRWFHLGVICWVVLMLGYGAAFAATARQDGQTIDPKTIRDAVNTYILRNAPWDSKQMRIKEIRFKEPVRVPSGRITLQVAAPRHMDWIGGTPFTVQIWVQGQKIKRLTVPALIEVWSDVVVSTKPLGRFQPIQRDDIRIQRMNLAGVPSNAVVSLEQALGRRANRSIAPDCILRRDQIELAPVVKRGDIVQVVAETPVLRISVKGMAKQDGAKGDRIKVVNLRSKKVIYAQVVDGQTVSVEF
jgi:flagellar basal body P-ring formation protein FlgA